jgi:flagellin-like protein
MKRAWIIRRNEEAVSPVIATILMVAITVVLAAVLYVMVSGLIGGTTASEPNVQLSQADGQGNDLWKINIAGVSESKEVDSFKALITKDGALWKTLDPLSGTESNVTFTDLGGESKLTTGDYFLVQCDPGANYELSVAWRDSGNVKGSEVWDA